MAAILNDFGGLRSIGNIEKFYGIALDKIATPLAIAEEVV